MTMKRNAGALNAALLVLAAAASWVQAESWDVTAAFSIEHGNPNGVWSYGWMDVGFASLTLYTNHGYLAGSGGGPQWYGWGGDRTPTIWMNVAPPEWGVPTGWLSFHPGNGGEPSVARWTAPAGLFGSATVSGQFLPGDGGPMQVAVRKNNTGIWHGVDSGVFDLQTTVSPGDTIDFTVYGGYYGGNTPLSATIMVPEPCSMLALTGGIALLGLARRRLR